MKNVHLLFPCSPLNSKDVDENFEAEYVAAKKAGFDIFLFDHDRFIKDAEKLQHNVELKEKVPYRAVVILRSWMLNDQQYTLLSLAVEKEGSRMWTSEDDYERRHYWPMAYEAYPHLHAISPRCFWTDGTAFSVKHVKQFFHGVPIVVKDHVKSAKGANNAMFIKNSGDKREVWTVVENMIKERGPLFERGIVFKERLNIKKDKNGCNIEVRLFFHRGRAFSIQPNDCDCPSFLVPSEFVNEIGKAIGEGFYSVDIALCEGDKWMVIECGDGQVSGLTPSADPEEFYRKLKWSTSQLEPGELDERLLADDHPVHWDYVYVVDGKVVRSDIKGTVAQLKADLRSRGMEALNVTSCDVFGRLKKSEVD